jgi:N-acetylmuramoyl-L-alanine amidase
MTGKIPILAIFIATVLPSVADGAEIAVAISGAEEKIGAFEDNGVVYFSLSELTALMGEKLSWESAGLSVSYTHETSKILFNIGSPFIRIDDSIKNMTYPASLKKGQLYLPAATFLPLFDGVRTERVFWDKDNSTIRIGSNLYMINDISFSAKANGLLIEIFLAEPIRYEIFPSEGNWLNIVVPGGTINRNQLLSRRSSEYLLDLNAHQLEGAAQLSLRLKREIGKFTHRLKTNPDRIQISLVDSTATVGSKPKEEAVGPDKFIDRIIIDAGHGGADYGAIGLNSTREKEIVLDIAKRLAKLIRKEKIFEAILTRDKDIEASLEDRTRIANSQKGDIFVSIHANASLKRAARGFQVFFLAPAKNDSARAAAQLENAPFLVEKPDLPFQEEDDLGLIISDMIQNEFQAESADLAAMIDKEFRKNLKETSARGIDQAGFFVLNGVYMPSVLVETAFITNRDDEKLLNDKSYRQKVAEAIYEGLKRFKAKYEN